MNRPGILEYTTSAPGKIIVGLLYSGILAGTNYLIFRGMSVFFSISTLVYLVVSVATLLFIGKINNWKSFLWFTVLLFFISAQIPLRVWVIVGYLLITILAIVAFSRRDVAEFSPMPNVSFSTAKMFVIASHRIIFYNLSYLSFPLLFIWLGSLGILLLFGMVSLTSSLTHFVYLTTIAGVMFGFLQPYIQRHEEKVQKKFSSQLMSQIPWNRRFSFREFQDYLDRLGVNELDVHDSDVDTIENSVKEINNGFPLREYQWLSPYRKQGKEINQYEFNIYSSGAEEADQLKFLELEDEMSECGKLGALRTVYGAFFDRKMREILDDIDRKSLQEMSWELLESINILEESFPTMNSVSNSMDSEPETYEEFLSDARIKTIQESIEIALGIDDSE